MLPVGRHAPAGGGTSVEGLVTAAGDGGADGDDGDEVGGASMVARAVAEAGGTAAGFEQPVTTTAHNSIDATTVEVDR